MLLHPSLMLITDYALAKEPVRDIVTAALAGGCKRILYRAADISDDAYIIEGKILRAACLEAGAQFFVAHRMHLAADLQADGLHVSSHQSAAEARRMVGDMLIGQSCHSAAEIAKAVLDDVDYISLSPVFPTASKPDYGPAMGLDALSALISQCDVPVYAQGGILPEHASDCMQAGAAGIAIMGPIMKAENPEALVAAYIAAYTLPAKHHVTAER